MRPDSTAPPSPLRLPRSRAGNDPQYLLITLLGDYWIGREEFVPSAALVALLAEFGVSESSARQAMRRLVDRDLLAHERVGRNALYGTPRRITDAYAGRVRRALGFGSRFPEWDGEWTVVSFSVPEKDRDVRRWLRNGLRALKFGLLNDAIWVSPHERAAEVGELLDRLDVADASVMRARLLPRASRPSDFSAVFGLEQLAADYRDFIARYESTVDFARSGRVAPAEALVLRTALTSDWLSFRVKDPDLPEALLPGDWPRPRAHEIFIAIYDSLGTTAEGRFRQLLAAVDPELASLASHNTTSKLGLSS